MDRKSLSLLLVATLGVALIAGAAAQRGREDDREKSKGSVKGDPVLTAFSGQQFEFHGKPEHYYNLVSEPGVFQMSTLLKPAVMFDHNGTYMKGVALKQRNGHVIVETGADFEEDITVTVNGELLEIESAETESTKRVLTLDDGSTLEVVWQLFAPEVGPMVEIRSASIYIVISLTAPFPDAGGVLQPNYLNSNVTLLREPAQDLQGVLGETYNHIRGKDKVEKAATAAPKFPLYDDSKYEIEGYFGATLAQTMASLMKQLSLNMPVGSINKK